MRAAVMTAPREARVEDVPRPEPGAGEVRVRLAGSGVCGSNLPVWEGRAWFSYPLDPGEPGHEGWGTVEATGPSVEGLSEGDRVAVLGSRAFADCLVCPSDSVVVLPPELDGAPFPGEAIGCAMNVFRRSAVREGETVAVVGVGFLGALLVRLSAAAGARVTALSRRPFARQVAREAGAEEAASLEPPAVERARRSTGGRGFDCVIEATGLQAPLDVATALTRERGRLIVAGYHQDGSRVVDMRLWNWRGLDVINAHERDPEVYRRGMLDGVRAVRDGTLDLDAFLTHRFELDDLPEAMRTLERRPPRFLKAVVLT